MSESSSNAKDAPDVCLSFVLLFTIFIIVTQKLVLQQSKNVTAKCTETETLSPPPSIQYLLDIYSILGRVNVTADPTFF